MGNGRTLERIRRTLAAGERPDSWRDNRISYAENLRAELAIVTKSGGAYWHTLGCTPAEARLIEPLALHFYSLVHQGELSYLEAQRNGASRITDHRWKTRLQELLKSHNAYDSRIQAGLDDLERYHVLAGQVRFGELALTAELLEELLHLRSADLHVMIRVVDRLKGRTPDEEFYQLLKAPMALWDIGDDFGSYQRDRAEGRCNALRLHVQLHGKDQARTQLQALRERITTTGRERILAAAKPALVRYLTSTPLANLNLPVVPELLGLLPRGVLARAAAEVFRLEGLGLVEIPEPVAEEGHRKEISVVSS